MQSLRSQFPIFLFLAPFFGVVSCLPNTNTNEPPPIHRKMFALVEKFDRFDDNGDGYLTRKELEAGVKTTGTVQLTKSQYDQVMLVYDTDKDKKISLDEAKIAAKKGPVLFEN